MRIYDITLTVDGSLAPWPGDTPYGLQWNLRRRDGAPINLGTVTMSLHTGTHVDAPFHFDEDGATIEALELQPYLGPARVVDVSGRETIRRQDLEGIDLRPTPRLLLRTGGWPDPSRFPERIPVMEPELPFFLREQGVVLVGLDVPSVDQIDSVELPVHHALGEAGIRILESLRLTGVPEGTYDLAALPLKLGGADGSPVRAVLLSAGP